MIANPSTRSRTALTTVAASPERVRRVTRRSRGLPALLVCSALAGLTSCGGRWDGGEVYVRRPKFAQGPGRETSFRVGLPGEGWRPLHDRATQVAWQREDPPGAIQVRSQCEEHGDSDLHDFTDHLRIDFGAWEILEQEPLRLIGREALRTRVSAALDGVPVMLEIYVVKKDGCLFDLTYTALPYAFERGLPAFERVVEGFAFPLERSARSPRDGADERARFGAGREGLASRDAESSEGRAVVGSEARATLEALTGGGRRG